MGPFREHNEWSAFFQFARLALFVNILPLCTPKMIGCGTDIQGKWEASAISLPSPTGILAPRPSLLARAGRGLARLEAERAALVTGSPSRLPGTALAEEPKAGAAHTEMHSGCGNAFPINPSNWVVWDLTPILQGCDAINWEGWIFAGFWSGQTTEQANKKRQLLEGDLTL